MTSPYFSNMARYHLKYKSKINTSGCCRNLFTKTSGWEAGRSGSILRSIHVHFKKERKEKHLENLQPWA